MAIVNLKNFRDLGRVIAANAITDVILWPFLLKQVLDELSPDFAKPRDLTVTSSGAPISAELRQRVFARLAPAIFDY